MIIDLIAASILVVCLIGLAIIISRKFPTLAAVDPATTAGTVAERKSSLIEQRLKRKFFSFRSRVATAGAPMAGSVGAYLHRAQKKLVDLEHEYKVRSLPVFLSRRQRQKVDREITALLAQASALIDDHEYAAAEEKALQAIRLEPRSVPAFELLGQLYLTTKEYQHAKEIYHYLLKLTGDSDAIYEHLGEADRQEGDFTAARDDLQQAITLNRSVATYHLELAQVYLALEDPAQAFASIQEAARLEPNNPKVLDQYVEISITAGKKQFAEDTVARIAAANPENAKIADWRQRIEAIEAKPLTSADESSVEAPPL